MAMVLLTFGAIGGAASAQGLTPGEDKSVVLAPYLWGTSIDGTSTVGALPPLDIDASFSDLFSNLNFAMSLHTEFRSNDWVLVIDPTYLSLEMEAKPPLPSNPVGTMEVDIWLVEVWGGYRFTPNWEVIGGLRYQDQDIKVSGLPSPPFPQNLGVNESWTDWFAGVRGTADLGDKWFMNWRADVVFAGDSDTSWNTSIFFNRRFGETMALNLGYRYFQDDYNKQGVYRWDVTQQGPIVGYTWVF
jgi:hypothetical protein